MTKNIRTTPSRFTLIRQTSSLAENLSKSLGHSARNGKCGSGTRIAESGNGGNCGMRMAELVDWRHSLRISLARNARRISCALTNRLGLCRSISADPSIYDRDLPIPQFLQIPYLRSATPVITYATSPALAFYYDTPGQIDYLFIPGSAAADVAMQLVPIFCVCSLLTYGFKYARRSRLENRQNRRRRYASYL
jgi:hypothetical protein